VRWLPRARQHHPVLHLVVLHWLCIVAPPRVGRRREAPQARRAIAHCVVIRPLLVETIQRPPHRTMESTLPSPGTVSPRAAFQMPPAGPSNVAVPSTTFRNVQPSIVVGLVSGTGTSLRLFFPAGFCFAITGSGITALERGCVGACGGSIPIAAGGTSPLASFPERACAGVSGVCSS
jgi:hypothetical protein